MRSEAMTTDGFKIVHHERIVNVIKSNVPAEHYDSALSRAHDLLRCFRASTAGSTWGCDGVGYGINKQHGLIDVKKSGVGPRKFAQGLKQLKEAGLQ